MTTFLSQSGVDETGRPVIAGGFDLVSTKGVPLELLVELLNGHRMVVDWPDYLLSAVGSGQNLRSLQTKITMAIGEVFGPMYREQFEIRLRALLANVENA